MVDAKPTRWGEEQFGEGAAIQAAKARLEAAQRGRDERGREPGQDRNPRGGRPYKRASAPEPNLRSREPDLIPACYNADRPIRWGPRPNAARSRWPYCQLEVRIEVLRASPGRPTAWYAQRKWLSEAPNGWQGARIPTIQPARLAGARLSHQATGLRRTHRSSLPRLPISASREAPRARIFLRRTLLGHCSTGC